MDSDSGPVGGTGPTQGGVWLATGVFLVKPSCVRKRPNFYTITVKQLNYLLPVNMTFDVREAESAITGPLLTALRIEWWPGRRLHGKQ